MSNEKYAKYGEACLKGEGDVITADFRFVVVDADVYTANLATDEFLDDIPSGAVVGTSDLLTGKTAAGGAFAASGIAFSDTPGTPEAPVVAELLVGYIDTADPATSRLVVKIDTGSNLPITLNGSNITAIFPDGEIFNL